MEPTAIDNRGVVTGVGLETAFGPSVDVTWEALARGESAVRRIEAFDVSSSPVRVAATIDRNGSANLVDVLLDVGERVVSDALGDAAITNVRKGRCGFFFGTPVLDPGWDLRMVDLGAEHGASVSQALYVQYLDGSAVARQLAARFGFASSVAVHTACATGSTLVLMALEQIRAGHIDWAICAGVDVSVTEDTIARFALLGALSTRVTDPHTASRPFAEHRDGFVLGEGGGALVLESEEFARLRSAPRRGVVLGGAESLDTYHRTRPDPEARAVIRCMQRALRSAGVTPDKVDLVFAHGTGTADNDATEAAAIHAVFGERSYHVPVCAPKSGIGHTLSASALIESILALESLQRRVAIPIGKMRQFDPTLRIHPVREPSEIRGARVALKNAFGFGGQNACLVLARADEAR